MGALKRIRVVRGMLVGASTSCVVFLGCTTPPAAPSPGDYVFFSRYPELRRVASSSGVFLYANPNKPLRDHDRFIVNSASIVLQPESAYWLDPAKSQELADFFRHEIVSNLSGKYSVVDALSPGVLRVSVILADSRRRQPPGSAGASPAKAEYQPVLFLLITDATTGEAVVLLRDLNRGDEFAAVARSDEAAARRLLSDWARTLRVRLDEAQLAAGQRPTSQP